MHVIIEIAISMVGLYIIFSIVNSALVEVYAQYFNKRGKFLKKSLENFFKNPEDGSVDLANKLYDHKLVQAFKEKKDILPNYIEKHIFSQALMELIFKDVHGPRQNFKAEQHEDVSKKLPEGIQKTLHFIVNKATDAEGTNFEKVQTEIEELYETYMKRVSEWYHKKTKLYLGITGIMLAFMLNLDSVNFYTALKNDGELRREQVSISKKLNANRDQIMLKAEGLKDQIEIADFEAPQVQAEVKNLINEILDEEDAATFEENMSDLKIGIHQFAAGKNNIGDFAWGFLGIFLTGLALSFGSTFWFNLLRKLVRG